MLVIKNYSEIKEILPKINEKFEIQKGKRKAIYKIINSKNFDGCYDLIRCDNLGYSCGTYVWRETQISGCGSIEGCAKRAYDCT